jgi:hypothetical protein
VARGEFIDYERFSQLVHEGKGRKEIAEELGMHVDTVSRMKSKLVGPRKGPKPMDQSTRDRIKQLSAEGMPSTWISEDVGYGRSTVIRVSPFGSHNSKEWLTVWQKIRRSEVLLELHREFAP